VGVQDCDRPRPIYSSLHDDPACAEIIDEFVVGVSARVDHLQDADSRGNLRELEGLAAQLALDAQKMGFGPLAEVAAAVERACADGYAKPAHDGVVALTEVALRIRLSHRGAMS
jgi:hypothetical protein